MPIRNIHRTVGTIISSRIARKYGSIGLPEDTITLSFTGAAGQSFGAFCSRGMTLILTGEANDYVAKGLSGAKVIVRPYREAAYRAEDNFIAGNVILYGATSGQVYINGRAGERFAIRNSGAHAVVEGIGDHGCEYMTGGRVVVLGSVGVNFGAGMSGGIAYVYDETGMFDAHCNLEMVDIEMVNSAVDAAEVRRLIERHVRYTDSLKGKAILADWEASVTRFVKVFPMEYRRVLGQMIREDLATERQEVLND
jgi:glutamate synthase domain-containing protein 3